MTDAARGASPKITRPHPHRVVARERLYTRIAEAGTPIVWLCGPPGAGKTTLAASYLDARKLTSIWYQVDSGDSDPATFFYYMGVAAARSGALKRSTLPLLPSESPTDIAAFTRVYFRKLFELLPRPIVLVIDNYHDASGSAFESLMRAAFSEVPDQVTVLVLSLSGPVSSLARLVANNRVSVVDAEDIRFTREESRQVLLSKLKVGDDIVDLLHERSGGWAAGLVLMAEYTRRADPGDVAVLAHSHEAVFDYFAGEIFASATAENQRILMLTSALKRITVKIADAMTGGHASEPLLDYLYRHHLFTDRRHGAGLVYQYHGLFRAFLRERATVLLSAEECAEAAGRAALVLETDNEVEDAVLLYFESRDWTAATRLILAHAHDLYAQGRWRTVLDWIAAMPGEVVEAAPWLGYWIGACQVWVNPPTARAKLEQAFEQFARLGDRAGQILAAGSLSRACILDPKWHPLDRWIVELQALLESDIELLAPLTQTIGFSRLLYATLARQPQEPKIADWAERTLATLATDPGCNEAVMAGFSLMMYYNWTGDTSRQEDVIRQIQPLLSNVRLSVVSLTYWKFAHANYMLRSGAPAAALTCMDEALELATSNGLAIAAIIKRYRIAQLLVNRDLARAAEVLQKLETAPRVEPYYEMRAWLALHQDDLATALAEATIALQTAGDRGRTYYQILDLLLLAVVHAERGDSEQALSYVGQYRHETSTMDGGMAEYQSSLVEAYVALLRDDRTGCATLLRSALRVGSQQRYQSHWGWSPRMMAHLYGEALNQGIETAYVRSVIKRHRLLPASPEIQDWPWPINIYTLGRFAVMRDGELLRVEGKAQRKPIELIKALVALGGSDVPADKLIDELWPTPSEGDGQKALEITIHRLRKLLGSDDAVKVTDRRVSLNVHMVWVDVWALERKLSPLVPAASAAKPDIALLEAAAPQVLNLYRGHFLAGETEEPSQIPMRNRLAGRFQRFVLRLGEHWETNQTWARAAELYERAIELDPLAETFYRRYMVCLRAQGQRAEAMEVFRRCRQTLSVVLGVAPSAETEGVFRQLHDA